MEFRRLSAADNDLYEKAIALYKISFPHHEQRESGSQIAIMGNKEYHFNIIYDENIWVGIILCWETQDFIYVEHFCILPSMRNKCYGQKTLQLLNTSEKTVILEIDPPIDDISIKRKSFYERTGYHVNSFVHIHPPYDKEYNGHNLVVMSYPNCLSEKEYTIFNDYLKNVVMKNMDGSQPGL